MILSTILCFSINWPAIFGAIVTILFIVLLVAPDKYNDFWKW
jgi:hypothetical protein